MNYQYTFSFDIFYTCSKRMYTRNIGYIFIYRRKLHVSKIEKKKLISLNINT